MLPKFMKLSEATVDGSVWYTLLIEPEVMYWLLKNIGPLNDTWYYARIPIGEWYVPCIVIDDEKKAVWFRLRWA